MATTLGQLVTMVRSEAGHSLAASQGINSLDTLKYLIKRTEKQLYMAHSWPELETWYPVTLGSGQSFFAYPANVAYDRIKDIYCAVSQSETPTRLEFGLDPQDFPTDSAQTAKGRPVRWQGNESGVTVFPVPSETTYVRVVARKPLNDLVADGDVCTLDDTLIVMFVAAELLTRAKAADAERKQREAERYLLKLLGDKVSRKARVSTFGSQRRTDLLSRPYIDYIP